MSDNVQNFCESGTVLGIRDKEVNKHTEAYLYEAYKSFQESLARLDGWMDRQTDRTDKQMSGNSKFYKEK